MRGRLRNQDGHIGAKLQMIVILGVVAFAGLVVVPVWVSRASGPREVVTAANTDAVAKVYAIAVAEGCTTSPLTLPGPGTAAALRASLLRVVVNQRTHSSYVVAGDDWRAGAVAPGVWVTRRPQAAPTEMAKCAELRHALAGTVIVYVAPDTGIDVFAVSLGGDAIESLEHLGGS